MITNCALIMLASGRSERFGDKDKLLAEYRGHPLCWHASQRCSRSSYRFRIAVVANDHGVEQQFRRANWDIVRNSAPECGQSHALRVGVDEARKRGASAIVIGLADMPMVTTEHYENVRLALSQSSAVMSRANEALLPPAGFRANHFEDLLALTGDVGAKAIFMKSPDKVVLEMAAEEAVDVDTPDDLVRLSEVVKAHA